MPRIATLRPPRLVVLLLALLAAVAGSARAQPSARLTADEVAAWREDLRVLATELPARHPLLFAGYTPTRLTPERLDSAVRALDAKLPSMARHEAVVGLMRIVAMVGAGHTSINPLFDPALGFRYYPLELHAFRDGLYVLRADREHASLVGARVMRIGRLDAEAALRAVGEVVAHENEQFLRAYGVAYLMMPEVLHALGIVADMGRATLEVEQGGKRRTATIAPAGRLTPTGHHGPGPIDKSGWAAMRPADVAPPLYLSREEPHWHTFLPESRTLYVAYRSAVPPSHGPTIPEFFRSVFAAADSLPVERLVLDLRENGGGESFFNRQLVQGLVRRPRLDRPGALFAVIGRYTYSAAQNLVNELERYTAVTFVGEPTGSPPAFFGDHRPLVLPKSGISVNVSTLWWQPADPRDRRLHVAPRIYAEPTAAEYRAGLDPAMHAILTDSARPKLADVLAAAIEAADEAAAFRGLEEYRGRLENRYANVEAEVNALGYELLRAGRADRAALVFGVNVRAHPQSANVYDSLAEAYEQLGRRDEAVRNYRRALELNPEQSSAVAGLRRLGAEGATAGH
jgi:hypothetical protein